MRTKVFKSGNSHAVRIPAEMAYPDGTVVEITRAGNTITIMPAENTVLLKAIEYLRSTPPPAPLGPIERTQTRPTRWDTEEERRSEVADPPGPFEPPKPGGGA
ncbi:MAG: hypothetical protein JSR60_14725 [Proteobacteria bacterium]|nr:hypothetical protein [Pseudomonadota bacterium]